MSMSDPYIMHVLEAMANLTKLAHKFLLTKILLTLVSLYQFFFQRPTPTELTHQTKHFLLILKTFPNRLHIYVFYRFVERQLVEEVFEGGG